MADGLVVLGTIAIVGLVAVTTVALVYNRSLWVRGNSSEVQVQTGHIADSKDPVGGMRDDMAGTTPIQP